eukprot:5431175-Pyramimonas_sp.AAC.1
MAVGGGAGAGRYCVESLGGLVGALVHHPAYLSHACAYCNNSTSFYGSSCAKNGKDALNTPELPHSCAYCVRALT